MNPKYIVLLAFVYSTNMCNLVSSYSTNETRFIRTRKGVAANVAASASSKTQRVPMSAQVTTSSRVPISSYDEPPRTISDSNLWSGSFTAEEKLVAQLLNRGSLTVRPNGHMNQSTNPVHVDITYNVVQILGFSQAEETLSISGWFTMRWTDPRLTWSPEEFSDIQEVSLPTTNLWIPDVGVMNGKASTDFDFSAGVRGRVTVNKEGSITWLHGAVLDVTCPLDVSFFPFDYQTCFLILVPWQSGEQQLLLQPFTHGSAVDNSYLPNSNVSEWEIQSVHFVRKKYRSDLNVTYQYVSIAIHLKRQPLYFIVLVLVPFSMLSALACLIFTLDDTGDRLSVALSLVLSMTMYVVIVSTNAPRSMRTLPVLGIFLLDQLGLLSIATILAVMNNKLYQSTELVDWQDFIYAISGTGQDTRFRAADGDSDSPIGQARNAKRHLSSNTTNPNIIHNINTINNKNQNDNDNNGRQKQDVLRQHDYKIVHSKFRDNDLLNKSFHAIRNKHKTNTSERSPWMEHLPLSSEQITKQSYLSTPPYKYSSPSITESSSSEEDIDDDNDENDDDGDCGDLNSDNSERIFRTTVTATAAAALAATHVLASSYGATNQNLSHLRTCGGKLNANTNKNIPIDTPNISELSKSRKYSGSALPVKRDHDHLKSKLAARAAIMQHLKPQHKLTTSANNKLQKITQTNSVELAATGCSSSKQVVETDAYGYSSHSSGRLVKISSTTHTPE
ncbi:unnamed protein product [Heterobilharzia americana]|nr:unnamed protein product [Heterobilharzia americana]